MPCTDTCRRYSLSTPALRRRGISVPAAGQARAVRPRPPSGSYSAPSTFVLGARRKTGPRGNPRRLYVNSDALKERDDLQCQERLGGAVGATLTRSQSSMARWSISTCPSAYRPSISFISACLDSSKISCSLSTSSENAVEVSWAVVTASCSWDCQRGSVDVMGQIIVQPDALRLFLVDAIASTAAPQ